MLRTWILVADGGYARVYLSTGPEEPLLLVHELEHPEARARGQELLTDMPAMDPGTLPRDYQASVFARQIANLLDVACSRNEYDKVMLIAPPSFLGNLRKSMSKQVAQRVSEELAKDLVSLKPHELRARLEPR